MERRDWLDDPFVFAKVVEGFNEVLRHIAPPGDPVTPNVPADPPDGLPSVPKLPIEHMGVLSARSILAHVVNADGVCAKPWKEDGVSHEYSNELKRAPLIKGGIGPEVVARIGGKE